jgi:RNA polymerase sigma-70 factor (ECF subfamily)
MNYQSLNNETSLLKRVSEGDQSAFNVIYRFYLDRVYSLSYNILKKKHLADEVVQDVFTKFWQQGDSVSKIENLHAWLRTLTRNTTLKMLRHQVLLTRVNKEQNIDWQTHPYTPEDDIFFKDAKEILLAAISTLPPQQQKTYILCHINGLSYEEAARELQLSKLTVHSHMKQALRNIRKFMSNYYTTMLLMAIFNRYN